MPQLLHRLMILCLREDNLREHARANLVGLCREKLQAAEAKVRGLVQDKNNALVEKGNLERELKQLKATTGRLTKVRISFSKSHKQNGDIPQPHTDMTCI